MYIATNFSFAQNILDDCNLNMSKSNLTIAIQGNDIECLCKSSKSKFTLFFTFGSWCEPCILHLPNAIKLSKQYDLTLYVLLIDNENTKREFDAVNYLKKLNENLNILIIKDFKNLKPKKKYINFLNDITPENFENINDMSKYLLFNEEGKVLQITTWKDNREYDWQDDTNMLKEKIIPILENN